MKSDLIISQMAKTVTQDIPPIDLEYMLTASWRLKEVGQPTIGIGLIRAAMGRIGLGEQTPHRVSKQFGLHLQSVALNVKAEYLKSSIGKNYYFEFPDYGEYKAACIEVWGVPDELGNSRGDIMLAFCFFGEDYANTIEWMRVPIKYEENMSEAIARSFIVDKDGVNIEQAKGNIGIVTYLTNLVLYVESGKPDLERVPGKKCGSTSLKKQRNFEKKHSVFDVCRVGYNTHTPNSTETSKVIGHFRWQPWGPLWSKIKLIWIGEHERKRNI